MQGSLVECVRILLDLKSCDDEKFDMALQEIHRLVFGGSGESEKVLTPSDLIFSSEVALGVVGGRIKKKKPLEASRLPIEIVVVEVLTRLTRILFWDTVVSAEKNQKRRMKIIEEDAKELEEILLPRLFLKMSITPKILRDVLMKAPLEVFARLCSLEQPVFGEVHKSVPDEIISTLNGLKLNFGCDFLSNICIGANHSTINTGDIGVSIETKLVHSPPECEMSGISSTTDQNEEENRNIIRERDYSVSCSKVYNLNSTPDIILAHTGSQGFKVCRKSLTTSIHKLRSNLIQQPRHSLPAYMLTKRKSGNRATIEINGGSLEEFRGGRDLHSPVSEDGYISSEDYEIDAEVLAPATPVKKKVRKENGAVPPSPSRPTHEEIIFSPNF